jgi:hypothetical protein
MTCVVLAGSLLGCSSGTSGAPSVPDVATSSSPEVAVPEPSEGPVSEPATFPGGLTVEVVSVEATPAESWVAEDIPGHDTWVTVQVRLSAEQDTPLVVDELGGTGARGELLFGPNLTAANSWASDGETPTRITPDSPVTLIDEFSLPADGLGELRYSFTPDSATMDSHTFTGVELLL